MRKLFQALALLAAFVLLIALPQVAADGVRSALTLCGRVILPSLFPFLCAAIYSCCSAFLRGFPRDSAARRQSFCVCRPQRAARFCSAFLAAIRRAHRLLGCFIHAVNSPSRTLNARLPSVINPGRRLSSACSAAQSSKARRQALFFVRGSNHFRCTCLPLDREKTAHVRKVCCQAAAARIFCRSFFRVSAPRRDERNSNLHVCYGLFRSLPLFSACRRPLPAVRGTAVVPRYAGTVRRLRGADRLRACASLEAVHCISAFVLRRHKCSGTEPGRRAGVRAERESGSCRARRFRLRFPARSRSLPHRCCTRKAGPLPRFPARRARKRQGQCHFFFVR